MPLASFLLFCLKLHVISLDFIAFIISVETEDSLLALAKSIYFKVFSLSSRICFNIKTRCQSETSLDFFRRGGTVSEGDKIQVSCAHNTVKKAKLFPLLFHISYWPSEIRDDSKTRTITNKRFYQC